MAKRKKKHSSHFIAYLLVTVMIITVPVALIAAFVVMMNKAYHTQQQQMITELNALPEFDELETIREANEEAAEDYGFTYPVAAPRKTPEQIEDEAKSAAKRLTDKQFPKELLTRKIQQINQHCSPAKIGSKVTFQLQTTNETYSGIYKGRKKERHGVFIMIENIKVLNVDIAREYHYLFDDGIARVKAQDEIRDVRTIHLDGRKAYQQQVLKEYIEKFYGKSGYMFINGKWRVKLELHKNKAERLFRIKQNTFYQNQEQEIKDIIRSHQLLGFFPVPVPEDIQQKLAQRRITEN